MAISTKALDGLPVVAAIRPGGKVHWFDPPRCDPIENTLRAMRGSTALAAILSYDDGHDCRVIWTDGGDVEVWINPWPPEIIVRQGSKELPSYPDVDTAIAAAVMRLDTNT